MKEGRLFFTITNITMIILCVVFIGVFTGVMFIDKHFSGYNELQSLQCKDVVISDKFASHGRNTVYYIVDDNHVVYEMVGYDMNTTNIYNWNKIENDKIYSLKIDNRNKIATFC